MSKHKDRLDHLGPQYQVYLEARKNKLERFEATFKVGRLYLCNNKKENVVSFKNGKIYLYVNKISQNKQYRDKLYQSQSLYCFLRVDTLEQNFFEPHSYLFNVAEELLTELQ